MFFILRRDNQGRWKHIEGKDATTYLQNEKGNTFNELPCNAL